MIRNAQFYSRVLQTKNDKFDTQAEQQMKKAGGSKSTESTSTYTEYEINYIDTAFLLTKQQVK